MNEPKQGETRELIDAIKDLIPLMARVAQAEPQAAAGGVHQIMMQPPDAGERSQLRTEKFTYLVIGLLIGTLGWFGMTQLDNGRKIERYQDYQNMLWQRYPELRPENLKPKEDKK